VTDELGAPDEPSDDEPAYELAYEPPYYTRESRDVGEEPQAAEHLTVDGDRTVDENQSSDEDPAAEPLPRELVALTAMLEYCSVAGQVELERMLSATLYAGPSVTENRLAELLPLAEVLESSLAVQVPNHPVARVVVEQEVYDRARPAGAPPSQTLIKRYGGASRGGWYWACRAAWGLMPDGRKREPGAAWAYPTRGTSRLPPSSRDAVLASIRECALALGRRPSSHLFKRWVETQRRAKRSRRGERGRADTSQRLFGMRAVNQHFPNWSAALAAANITDAELADARAARLPGGGVGSPAAGAASVGGTEGALPGGGSPAALLLALSSDELAGAGFSEAERTDLAKRGTKGFRTLPLSRAAALAHALGGSLDWLAGVDGATSGAGASTVSGVSGVERAPGDAAPADVRFDGEAFNRMRKARHLREEAVLAKARLGLGTYRAIIKGRHEPTLGQAVALAGLVRSPLAVLST
jgi:hypothetical protein